MRSLVLRPISSEFSHVPPTSGKPVSGPPGRPAPSGSSGLQFNLLGMMVVMLVVGVMVAPAYYLVRGAQGQAGMQLAGILVALTSPLLGMTILSLFVWFLRWRNRRR